MGDGLFVVLMNPLGRMLEHFFLVDVGIVPFPYGAPVETGTGTTVAVLTMTGAELETAPTTPDEAAPDEPEPAEVGAAVSVCSLLARPRFRG